LLLNKSLTLLGADEHSTIIEGASEKLNINAADAGITITADNAAVNGFTVTNWTTGVWLDHSNGTTVNRNIITSNMYGVRLDYSFFCTVSDNIISYSTGGYPDLLAGSGVQLASSANNTVSDNIIPGSLFGIRLGTGESASGAYNNTIYRNLIEDSMDGMTLYASSNNTISCNSFIHNQDPVDAPPPQEDNFWSVGGRGNYWDDYTGLDDGSGGRVAGDGVGDTKLPWQGDDYPLTTPVNPIPIFWDNHAFPTSLMSNSTVSAFSFNQAGKEVTFSVIGPANTTGYFNLTVPKSLLSGSWTIMMDGADSTSKATIMENQTCTSIYLSYSHSAHSVQIIGTNVVPEYPTATALLLLTLAALLPPTALAARKMKKAKQTPILKSQTDQ
jgi:parallel beta-helix repeat protein